MSPLAPTEQTLLIERTAKERERCGITLAVVPGVLFTLYFLVALHHVPERLICTCGPARAVLQA